MRLAFLGTGSAFSVERCNGAVVVDGRLLLDAGAPLLPHMHRLGIDPAAIAAVFLTHFHGDHVLGLPPFMLYRAYQPSGPLTIVGPPGVEERVEGLLRLAWGAAWPDHARNVVDVANEIVRRGVVVAEEHADPVDADDAALRGAGADLVVAEVPNGFLIHVC